MTDVQPEAWVDKRALTELVTKYSHSPSRLNGFRENTTSTGTSK